MHVEIRMPQPAPDVDAVDLIDWLVDPGAEIALGEPIIEIETEKSTLEVEAPAAGILSEIAVASGSLGVPVGTVLGRIEAREQDSVPGSEAPHPDPTPLPVVPDTAPLPVVPDTAPLPVAPGPSPAPSTAPSPGSDASAPPVPPSTALARRLAERAGIEIGGVRGSGSHGRVTRADIERKISAPTPDALETHLRLEADCQASALLGILSGIEKNSGGTQIPLEAVILRATALALRNAPESTEVSEAEALSRASVEIALFKAETPRNGRRVRDVDRKGLAALSAELEAPFSEAAEASDGSDPETSEFVVVHIDTPGVNRHWPIPPPGTHVTVGTTAPRREPVVRAESVGVGDVLTLTLSADPSEIEAAEAGRLLAAIRRFIEHPLEMAL